MHARRGQRVALDVIAHGGRQVLERRGRRLSEQGPQPTLPSSTVLLATMVITPEAALRDDREPRAVVMPDQHTLYAIPPPKGDIHSRSPASTSRCALP